jgi:UDP-2,4-diacetamido-2,4,6-trideoxy-beta-L-altropyranose hydrolase
MSQVVMRADASIRIATGHVMRCLTLAKVFRQCGHQVQFICRNLVGNRIEMIQSEGFEVSVLPKPLIEESDSSCRHSDWLETTQMNDAMQTIQVLPDAVDYLVVDHYAIDAAWERKLKPYTQRMIVLDDLADRKHECDVLLDQHRLGASQQSVYAGYVPEKCQVLLGPKFALLRDEFIKAYESLKSKELLLKVGAVQRILLFMTGGADLNHDTRWALKALESEVFHDLEVNVVIGSTHHDLIGIQKHITTLPHIHLHVDISNIADLMAASDLAIGSGGGALWERGALGLPSMVCAISENQKQGVSACVKAGMIYLISRKSTPVQLREMLQDLIRDFERRKHLSLCSLSICSVFGSAKAAAVILSPNVGLHLATMQDARWIWQVRNQASVRLNSQQQSPISWETHQQWFDQALMNPNRVMLIVTDQDLKIDVGILRYDINDKVAEVSIALSEQFCGRGYGSAMLFHGEYWLKQQYAQIQRLRAIILEHNVASQVIFKKDGYERLSDLEYEKVLVE